ADLAANVNAPATLSFFFRVNGSQPPQAADDTYQVDAGTTLSVPAPGVLGNDTVSSGNRLSTILVTGTTHGALTFHPDGSFLYMPAPGYSGPDHFTYQASDGTNTSNVATVSIAVVPVTPAPVSRDDAYTAMQNRSLTVTAPGVLSNDL